MGKLLLIWAATLFVCAPSASTQSKAQPTGKGASAKPEAVMAVSKDPVGDADALFTRADDPAKDLQALSVLEKAVAADAKNYDLLWRAARATYYIGDFGTATDKNKFFDRGIAYGLRAVALQANGLEAHFWLAANYGGKAQLVGALKALSTVKKIRNEMLVVVKLNEGYENANAYLALGEIDRELPSVMGGNKKRAISYYEQGLKLAPANLDLKVALSKAYKDTGRKDDAKRLLEEVVKSQPATRIQREAQEEAKQLLGKP